MKPSRCHPKQPSDNVTLDMKEINQGVVYGAKGRGRKTLMTESEQAQRTLQPGENLLNTYESNQTVKVHPQIRCLSGHAQRSRNLASHEDGSYGHTVGPSKTFQHEGRRIKKVPVVNSWQTINQESRRVQKPKDIYGQITLANHKPTPQKEDRPQKERQLH